MRDGKASLKAILLSAMFGVYALLVVIGFGYRTWTPPVASEHGGGVDLMINYLLVATGIIFIAGHVFLCWYIIKYSGDGPADGTRVPEKKEWIAALIPVLLMTLVAEGGVLLIGLPVWGQVYGETPPDALVVEVTGKQFEWITRYPGKDGKFGKIDPNQVNDADNPIGLDEDDEDAQDDIVIRGVLMLPVDRAVLVKLRSNDVLHAFTIPVMRIKQDVIPGFTGSTQFLPRKTGKYEIACAELCGLGHYRMGGFCTVMEQAEFEKWLSEQEGYFE